MNNTFSTHIRHGDSLLAYERLDRKLRGWALTLGCEEHRYPILIPAETLCRAEYPEAFPHLLMAPAVAANPAARFNTENLRRSNWFLSPAVCYHCYSALEGSRLGQGAIFTARGCCFRNEDEYALAPGRRQVEFEMREVILLGEPAWLEEQLLMLQPQVTAFAAEAGMSEAAWQPANDPFFLPQARGKAHLQRLLGTKLELCLPDGLAITSINRHGTFFGERFDIRTADGAHAHSACIAFGLDRWVAHQSPGL